MPTLTKTKPEKPVPVVLNGNGCAVRNVHSYKIPLPKSLKATITIEYGWFDRSTGRAPGWRARANWQCNNHYAGHSGPLTATDHRTETKPAAIAAAVFDCLADFKREAARQGPGPERDNRERIAKALDKFHRDYTSAHGLTFAAEPVTSTAIAVRPAAVVTVEATMKSAPPLTFDPKAMAKLKRTAQPATAIAVREPTAVQAVPVEKLSTDERRELKANEHKIEQGAKAWLDLGIALGEISTKRLYRATHSTFETYCSERWHIERSMAYGLIDAARKHQAALPIAAKLKIEFTAESQFRPLKAVDESDLKAILQRTARLTPADADGVKRPTAKIIAQAVHEENTSPDDLKREKETARLRGAHQRQGLLQEPTAETPSRTSTAEPPMEAPESGMFARGPQPIAAGRLGMFAGDPSDFGDALTRQTRAALDRGDSWVTCPRDAEFMASGIPDSHVWKGERPVWAYELNTLKVAIRKLLEERGTDDHQFRLELAWLLTDAGIDVRSWEPPAKAKHSGRRAK